MCLGAPPPAECTQRPRQPSAPIRHFSCRHQRHIQEDFIDAGRLCLPGTSLLPAPEPSSCRLLRRACGLSATENRPLLSDDACRHPGFQRCWLNCGRQSLLPVSLDWGRGGHIFSNIQKRPYPSEFCKGEPSYSYSEGHAGHGPVYPSHNSPQIFGLLHRTRPAEKVPRREHPYSHTDSCLSNCFLPSSESSQHWGMGLDNFCIFQV